MKKLAHRLYGVLLAFITSALLLSPALAATENPMTGDERGGMMKIIIGVGAAALVVIIIVAVTGSKKKGKRK